MEVSLLPRASARIWAGLFVLLLPAVLISMDVSVLFVAGAEISEQLELSSTEWLWAMDLYSFVMAGLLVTMGNLGDRFGRRRLLLIGAAAFGLASTLLAFAPNGGLLILGRAGLAIGGATLAPSTMSLIRGMFHHEDQRRIAVGAWTIAFTGGAIAGPIIGGGLLEHFWWGSVFLINVPAMALLVILAPFLLPEAKNPALVRFDLLGSAVSLVAILGLVFTMKDLTQHGVRWLNVGSLLLAVTAALGFLTWQRRTTHPLIDLALFRIRPFSVAVSANTVVALVTSGLGVLVFPLLQLVHGLTPLQSALWALPTFAGSFLGTGIAASLARRFAPDPLLSLGLLCCAVGLGSVGAIGQDENLWLFIAAYTVLIFGCGITATIANSLVLSCAPAGRVGSASGVSETSNQLGAALGIAIFGTVASAVYRSLMRTGAPSGTDPLALDTLAGAVASARGEDDARSHQVLELARTAFTDGLTTVATTSAAFVIIVAAVTFLVVRPKGERECPGAVP